MYFELMHSRLVGNLRERVRNGEITERALARQAGVSQPHLHNVLKGVRILSARLADQVLQRLQIRMRDLLRDDELGFDGRSRRSASPRYAEVPLLEGWIGPDHPFPDLRSRTGTIPFLPADVAGAIGPVAVRLGGDLEMRHLFSEGDLALLAPLSNRQRLPEADAYFALDTGESGRIRQVERQADLILPGPSDGPADVIPPGPGEGPEKRACIRPADRNILEVIRARVIWIGRYLERPPIAERPVEEAGPEH